MTSESVLKDTDSVPKTLKSGKKLNCFEGNHTHVTQKKPGWKLLFSARKANLCTLSRETADWSQGERQATEVTAFVDSIRLVIED